MHQVFSNFIYYKKLYLFYLIIFVIFFSVIPGIYVYGEDVTLTVDADSTINTISDELFGNNLYPGVWRQDGNDSVLNKLLLSAKPYILRYPASDYAEKYIWDNMEYPSGMTDIINNDEAVNFARRTGTALHLVVNYSGYWSGSQHTKNEAIKKAKDWVSLMNKTRGLNVKYWEIGYQVYKQAGVTGTIYGNNFADFYKAMKEIDSSIKIGASSVPFDSNDESGYHWWMKDMLTAMKAKGVTPDFLAVQSFPGTGLSDAEILQKPSEINIFTANLNAIIKKYIGNDAVGKVKYFMTEYRSTKLKKLTTTYLDAMFTVQYLMEMGKSGWGGADIYCIMDQADPVSRGDYGILEIDRNTRPTFLVTALLSKVFGRSLLSVGSSNPASLLKVYAGKNAEGNLTLLLVNNSPDNELSCEIQLKNFSPALEANQWIIAPYGKTPDNNSSPSQEFTRLMINRNPNASPGDLDYFNDRLTSVGTTFSYSVPASNMVLIQIPDINYIPTPTPQRTANIEYPTIIPELTPSPSPKWSTEPGDMWFDPQGINVNKNDLFATHLYTNTGNQKLAAYNFEIRYNPAVIIPDTGKGPAKQNENIPGFSQSPIVNNKQPGILICSIFDIAGVGPGSKQYVTTVYWKAVGYGNTELNLKVNTLVDPDTKVIGKPNGINGNVNVSSNHNPNETHSPTYTPNATPSPSPFSSTKSYLGQQEGDVWFSPESITIDSYESCKLDLLVNTGSKRLSAIKFDVLFDSSVIAVDQSKGNSGVSVGKDGFTLFVNAKETNKLQISGFDVYGKGPNSNLHLATIYWQAVNPGQTRLEIKVATLVDPDSSLIGSPNGLDCSVEVTGQVRENKDTSNQNEWTQPPEYTPEPEITPEPEETPDPGNKDNTSDEQIEPTPTPKRIYKPGEVWLNPDSLNVGPSEEFSTEVFVHTGKKKLAAYGIDIIFNKDLIEIDKNRGMSGVEAGADGFLMAVNASLPGKVSFTGFDVNGKGPLKELHLVTIYWKSLNNAGQSNLEMTIKNLIDEKTLPLESSKANSGMVQIGASSEDEKTESSSSLPINEKPFSEFVTVDETQFFLKGKPFYYAGANVYDLITYFRPKGFDPKTSAPKDDDPKRIETKDNEDNGIDLENEFIDKSRIDSIFKALRNTGVTVVRTCGYNHDKTIGLSTGPAQYNEQQFMLFDYILKAAKDNDIKLIVVLENYNDIFGGIDSVLKWFELPSGEKDRYRYFTDLNCRQDYKSYLTYLLNRVNHYDKIQYKNNPAIMAWELINEPKYVKTPNTGYAPLRKWIDEMALLIKTIDKNHLVSIGFDGLDKEYGYGTTTGNLFVYLHQSSYLDFATAHLYPSEPFAALDLKKTVNVIKLWIETAHKKIGKPFVLEEWNVNEKDKPSWWKEILNTLYQYNANGSHFWYYVQQKPSALYEVAKDSPELEIFKDHAKIMNEKRKPVNIVTPEPTYPPDTTFIQIQAENYADQFGVKIRSCSEGGKAINSLENGDYAVYNNITFDTKILAFEARCAGSEKGGNIELRLDSLKGPLLGTCKIVSTGSPQKWSTQKTEDIVQVTGKHNLYLKFTGRSGTLFNLNWFRFVVAKKITTITPTPQATPTPTIIPGAGDVWLKSGASYKVNSAIKTEVHINTGDQKIAAYALEITYDKNIFVLDQTIGMTGVYPGKDGFVSAVNSKNPGVVNLSGFDVGGKGPGRDLHIATLSWKSIAKGSTIIKIQVKTLVDEKTATIGIPFGKDFPMVIN